MTMRNGVQELIPRAPPGDKPPLGHFPAGKGESAKGTAPYLAHFLPKMGLPGHFAALPVAALRPPCITPIGVRHHKSRGGAGGSSTSIGFGVRVAPRPRSSGGFGAQISAPKCSKAASPPLNPTRISLWVGKQGQMGRAGVARGETEARKGGRCWRGRVVTGVPRAELVAQFVSPPDAGLSPPSSLPWC